MDRIKRKKTQEFKRLKISKPKKAHERSWIFLRICRIISRQLAETEKAVGLQQNAVANKKGGAVAKNARKELEAKTGKIVITGENFFTTKKIMVNCKNKRKPN